METIAEMILFIFTSDKCPAVKILLQICPSLVLFGAVPVLQQCGLTHQHGFRHFSQIFALQTLDKISLRILTFSM
jgi:hypothetical protein